MLKSEIFEVLRPWCSFDLGEAFLIDITLKTGTCSFRSLTLFEGSGSGCVKRGVVVFP